MHDHLDHQLRTLVAIVALEPCCLCNGGSDHVGVFIPKRERATDYGVPEGKQRMLFYPICNECLQSEGAQERIEETIRNGIDDYRIVKR